VLGTTATAGGAGVTGGAAGVTAGGGGATTGFGAGAVTTGVAAGCVETGAVLGTARVAGGVAVTGALVFFAGAAADSVGGANRDVVVLEGSAISVDDAISVAVVSVSDTAGFSVPQAARQAAAVRASKGALFITSPFRAVRDSVTVHLTIWLADSAPDARAAHTIAANPTYG